MQLKHDKLLSRWYFKLNLRRYSKVPAVPRSGGTVQLHDPATPLEEVDEGVDLNRTLLRAVLVGYTAAGTRAAGTPLGWVFAAAAAADDEQDAARLGGKGGLQGQALLKAGRCRLTLSNPR